MSTILVFLLVVAVIAAWWLSRQRLMAKPWLEEGVIDDFPRGGASSLPTAKIGLGVFFAVVGSLFALLISAYFMRMDMADWQALPVPGLLWLNTGVLIASSLALQWATVAARRGHIDDVRSGIAAGGIFAVAFLAGQLLVWRQLSADGYYLAANPANSFFYLITAIHGLHLSGGLVALGRTAAKVWHRSGLAQIRLSIELCTAYWHFLLLIWLVLFGLLTHWADDVFAICRQLFT